ncbi:MAG: dihydroorotase [Nanoarchaeota archaeon]|nr:dihydroorotase [Nanoarchaeota archaeon]
MIDPHVHCRDWNQRHKETIEHALSVADRIGLSGIFDMPNTDPAIDSRELIERRLKDAEQVRSPVFYGLYAGLTSRPDQIREVVQAWKDLFPRDEKMVGVIGLKMFAGHSVGSLGIIDEDEQRAVYQTLTQAGYNGVLGVHCEKESLLKPELWDPSHPETHCDARPPEAEYESVRDQIRFAEESGFPGNLHVLHTSYPESVKLVQTARKKGNVRISCGATPHHSRLNSGMMETDEQGILYKVNPPLRELSSSVAILSLLKEGLIDFVETDHAPHTLTEKNSGKYMSGFSGMPYYPHFLDFLREEARFPESRIVEITHRNINKIFGLKLPQRHLNPDKNLSGEYEVDVYKGVRENAN